MRPKLMLAATVIAIAALSSPASRPSLAQTGSLDIAAIEQATGLKGQLIAEENVFKVTKPRMDVRIQIDQWEMPPFMGLASWAAFTPAQGSTHVMIMGDTVVFEDEVNPTMSAAFDAGLDVTALHNHFFFDEPKVYFMHIGVNTWAAFAGSDDAAVVDGDFAMLENELQPVQRAMRKEARKASTSWRSTDT